MVPLKPMVNTTVQLKSIIQSSVVHRYTKKLFFIFWAFLSWWWCRKRYFHSWWLKTGPFEVRNIRGQKIKSIVLSIDIFCSKIAFNVDVAKSTVTSCGCLGTQKKKQPAKETTNKEKIHYTAVLLPSWHAMSAFLCLGDKAKLLLSSARSSFKGGKKIEDVRNYVLSGGFY